MLTLITHFQESRREKMTNFVLLCTGGWGVGESEEEQAAVKAAWGAWFQENYVI
jgi:hypothetical protein